MFNSRLGIITRLLPVKSRKLLTHLFLFDILSVYCHMYCIRSIYVISLMKQWYVLAVNSHMSFNDKHQRFQLHRV